jgi:hypothetical protein
MRLKEFKIRCSAIGQIMTNPRSKTENLSETTKTYCQNWVKEQIYGIEKQIKSKYLTKGIDVEHESIDYYADHIGEGFLLKNLDHFESDFLTGTPDLILPNLVIDIKSSWDCFTFPLFETDLDKNYYAQIQGYMHLTGKKMGRLVYVLMNTPDELEWDEAADYSNIAAEYRIKEFDIDYDPAFIEKVEVRVLECRNYINEITKGL